MSLLLTVPQSPPGRNPRERTTPFPYTETPRVIKTKPDHEPMTDVLNPNMMCVPVLVLHDPVAQRRGTVNGGEGRVRPWRRQRHAGGHVRRDQGDEGL